MAKNFKLLQAKMSVEARERSEAKANAMNKEDYYSYSRIRTFDHCNRYYYYHYQLGLPTEPSYEAEFSSYMIHTPIAAAYHNEDTDFYFQWAALEKLGLKKPHSLYSMHKAITMYDLYWERYGKEDLETHTLMSAEEKFYDDDHEFQSIPDLVLLCADAGTMLVLDHKVSAYDAKPLPIFHRQLISQAITAAKQNNWPLNNIFVGINHFNLSSETVDRFIIPLDLKQVEEYHREYEHKRLQIDVCAKAQVWPKNAPDACVKYYGKQKKKCEFWDHCKEGMPPAQTSLLMGL